MGEVTYKAEKIPVNIGLIKRYIQSVENITGRKLHPKQIKKLKEALKNKKYEKLSKSETIKHRKKFSKSKKDALINEWERETGQKWPTYKDDILDKNGDIYRKAGAPYDAHHIIENNYGGNHEWWNIHPAKAPVEHQGGIHAAGSASRELFD